MDVIETLLPGVGRRYEFTLHDGHQLCVVSTRDDHYTVSSFEADDPDVGRTLFRLDEDEAVTLAEILGAPRIAVKLADLSREVPGLASEQVEILRRISVRRPFTGGQSGPHTHGLIGCRTGPRRPGDRLTPPHARPHCG